MELQTEKEQSNSVSNMVKALIVVVILAAIVTPLIMIGIHQAKVAAFVNSLQVLQIAAQDFYEDTGRYPLHVASNDNLDQKQLIKNTESLIAGWNGPYLTKELFNPFSEKAYIGAFTTKNANYQFDFDGDGQFDTESVAVIRIDQVSDTDAQRISDIFDNDADVKTGNKAWNKAGKVKRLGVNGNHVHVLLVFIAET